MQTINLMEIYMSQQAGNKISFLGIKRYFVPAISCLQ